MVSRIFRPAFGLFSVLALSFALSACGSSSSVVTESTTQSKPATASSTPATSGASAASPARMSAAPVATTPAPSASVQATPQATIDPIIKQAQARPGVPVPVPESMRRPLNSEEMQKALQQLPPEVRARIMGGRPMPSPQPTKK